MQLASYYKIKTGSGTPRTSRSPSMAASPGTAALPATLFMAYAGKDGTDVWWMQTPSPTDQTAWTRNEQVKFFRTTPLKTHQNPAMVFFQNTPGIIAIDPSGKFLRVCWFDGNAWQLEVPTINFPGEFLSSVFAIATGNTLHLVLTTAAEMVHLARTAPPLPVNPDPNVWSLEQGNVVSIPTGITADSQGNVIVSFITGEGRFFTDVRYLTFVAGRTTNWLGAVIEPPDQAPLFTENTAIASGLGGVAGLVYLGQGSGSTLFSATQNNSDPFAVPPTDLLLGLSGKVVSASGETAKGQQAPALTNFNGQMICLAHRGHDSRDIWFGTAPVARA